MGTNENESVRSTAITTPEPTGGNADTLNFN